MDPNKSKFYKDIVVEYEKINTLIEHKKNTEAQKELLSAVILIENDVEKTLEPVENKKEVIDYGQYHDYNN